VAIVWGFHDVRMERNVAQDELESRFLALRYALQRGALDYRIELSPDGTCSIEVGLRLTNNSADYLRYEIESINVVIEGRSVADATFHNRGTIIAPGGTDVFRYPFVRGVPYDWHTGFVEFTIRYGHPSSALRFQKKQALNLTASRLVGPTPPHDIHIQADMVRDSDVEDISAALKSRQS
jgi:hypothetical protein